MENKILDSIRDDCLSPSNDSSHFIKESLKYCDIIFDGLFCWSRTLAGEMATQPCDGNILKATKKSGIARKLCTENGTWFTKDNETNSWSDLTECGTFYFETNRTQSIQSVYQEWLPFIKNTSYVGYALSIAFLIYALVIFNSIKTLHCERNRLHTHFFISFLSRGVMFLLKNILFVKGTALTHQTVFENGEPHFNNESYGLLCKALISTRNYFILANFTFMLMEGLYLHNLMFLNLFSDNHGTKIYCTVGWALPALFISLWISLKMTLDDVGCWTEKSNYIDLCIDLPIGITITLNFVLFLIIVRVLVVKLNFSAAFIQQRRIRYRKLVKSTLILILLFGIPYVISLILSLILKFVASNQTLEILWVFFDQTFAAFQGIFACLVYCVLNNEVQCEVKRKYFSLKDRKNTKEFRRSRTISNTQQYSLHNLDEAYENAQFFTQTTILNNSKNMNSKI